MRPFGSLRYSAIVLSSHTIPDAFISSEKAKPAVAPALVPKMPNRLGPMPLRPPLSTVWQALHCANTRSPLAASPLCAAAVPNDDRKPNAATIAIHPRMIILSVVDEKIPELCRPCPCGTLRTACKIGHTEGTP